METIRERLDVTPKDQKKLVKFVTNKLCESMLAMEGEEKVKILIDKLLAMYDPLEVLNYELQYKISFDSNILKTWLYDFRKEESINGKKRKTKN